MDILVHVAGGQCGVEVGQVVISGDDDRSRDAYSGLFEYLFLPAISGDYRYAEVAELVEKRRLLLTLDRHHLLAQIQQPLDDPNAHLADAHDYNVLAIE